MGDYWTQHPEELKGQPKRVLGDYVESERILVPRRFTTKKEGTSLELICRSEHQQDYNGISGFCDSIKLDPTKNYSDDELKEFITSKGPSFARFREFYELQGLDKDEVKSQISFSFWEYIEGFNHTIVADCAIPNRYHIMTKASKNSRPNYIIIEQRFF